MGVKIEMTEPEYVVETEENKKNPEKVPLLTLNACCKTTIEKHASHNPMLVCPDCRKMVKCYQDYTAFKRYVQFCLSQGRDIHLAEYAGYQIVTFSK